MRDHLAAWRKDWLRRTFVGEKCYVTSPERAFVRKMRCATTQKTAAKETTESKDLIQFAIFVT